MKKETDPLFNSSKVAGTACRKTRCKWCFGERNLVYLLFIYINSVWGKELVVHGGCLYRDWVKTAWAKCLTKDSGQNACPGMMAPKQSVFGLMPVTVATREHLAILLGVAEQCHGFLAAQTGGAKLQR